MQLDSTVSLNTVKDVLVDTLGLQNQAARAERGHAALWLAARA